MEYGNGRINAANGKHFVLTQKGYDRTPDNVKPEREVGKPVFWQAPHLGFAERVPKSWLKNGWVEDVEK